VWTSLAQVLVIPRKLDAEHTGVVDAVEHVFGWAADSCDEDWCTRPDLYCIRTSMVYDQASVRCSKCSTISLLKKHCTIQLANECSRTL
jgi:hypothetical protein